MANSQISNVIKMSTNNDAILTAKISATVINVEGEDGIKMMDQMRQMANLLPGNCFAYESTFND